MFCQMNDDVKEFYRVRMPWYVVIFFCKKKKKVVRYENWYFRHLSRNFLSYGIDYSRYHLMGF